MRSEKGHSPIDLAILTVVILVVAFVAVPDIMRQKAANANFSTVFSVDPYTVQECEAATPTILAKLAELQQKVTNARGDQAIQETREELAFAKLSARIRCDIKVK